MSEEQISVWQAQAEDRRADGKVRRDAAAAYFDSQRQPMLGDRFLLQRHSDQHYSIDRIDRGRTVWRLNVYPGNCRLYADRHFGKPPYFRLPKPWTLADVVAAVQKAEDGKL